MKDFVTIALYKFTFIKALGKIRALCSAISAKMPELLVEVHGSKLLAVHL